MDTSSERVFNGSGKGYLPAGTIGNRTHILSERLKAGTEFKRLKKGHRPAPTPLKWTHILSYKPKVTECGKGTAPLPHYFSSLCSTASGARKNYLAPECCYELLFAIYSRCSSIRALRRAMAVGIPIAAANSALSKTCMLKHDCLSH